MHRSIGFLAVALLVGRVITARDGLVLLTDEETMESQSTPRRTADLAIDHALRQLAIPDSPATPPSPWGRRRAGGLSTGSARALAASRARQDPRPACTLSESHRPRVERSR